MHRTHVMFSTFIPLLIYTQWFFSVDKLNNIHNLYTFICTTCLSRKN
ncbi:hypothetical protein GLYMA_07G215850v4 [Glycine max]|nr:hypothetical protein GLYMA_07G215850v4 [Glycine max]KAH1087956.1 hypothetical protein GYH30_019161 [Glycine max]